MNTTHRDPLLSAIEQFTGHRRRSPGMDGLSRFIWFLTLALATAFAALLTLVRRPMFWAWMLACLGVLLLAGCSRSVARLMRPDGSSAELANTRIFEKSKSDTFTASLGPDGTVTIHDAAEGRNQLGLVSAWQSIGLAKVGADALSSWQTGKNDAAADALKAATDRDAADAATAIRLKELDTAEAAAAAAGAGGIGPRLTPDGNAQP